jgi:hypothetical protein
VAIKPIVHFISIRGNACENCGAEFTYDNRPEKHHCLIGRDKRYPELDNEINIELLGHVCCHSQGYVNSQEHAAVFAARQIERGYDVGKWYRSLPLKVKEAWLLNL